MPGKRSAEWLRGAVAILEEVGAYPLTLHTYRALLAEAEAREAAEPDLGTASPKRTGTIQVALKNGGAGKPLEYTDDGPTAAEEQVRKAVEKAYWIGCSPHEWPTVGDIPLLCHALIREHSRAESAAEVIAAAERALKAMRPSYRAPGCYYPRGWDAPAKSLHSERCKWVTDAIAAIAKWKEANK